MSLSQPTIRKLLRENLGDGPPLHLASPEAIEAFAVEVEQRFAHLEHVAVSKKRRGWGEEAPGFVLWVVVAHPRHRYAGQRFMLRAHGLSGELWLHQSYRGYGAEPSPVGSLDDLGRLILAFEARGARARAQAAKRAKVKALRGRALTHRIGKLARAAGFTFALDAKGTQLKIYVRLADAPRDEALVALRVPKKSVEGTLAVLSDFVSLTKELHRLGVSVQFHRRPGWRLGPLEWHPKED